MTFQPQKPKDKAATRRKTTTVRKTKKFRKKAAKKARLRPASPQKARPTAKAAVKPAPVSPPAQPEAVRPTPSLPAQPGPPGERIGFVTHYYSQPSVATIRLESGTLRVGDLIHICGHTIPNCRRLWTAEAAEGSVAPSKARGEAKLGSIKRWQR